MELNSVYDPRLLDSSKVYQIDGGLYQYLRQSGTSTNPRYVFGHLPGQTHLNYTCSQRRLRINEKSAFFV